MAILHMVLKAKMAGKRAPMDMPDNPNPAIVMSATVPKGTPAQKDTVTKLKELKELLDAGALSQKGASTGF